MKRKTSVREVSPFKKEATTIRLTVHDIERSRKIAEALQKSISDYFREIINKANDQYEKRIKIA
jgi:predicted DNA-binding protein